MYLDATVRPPVAPKQNIAAIEPTKDQAVVLYVIAVYFVVILAAWNIPGARQIINPLKLLTIGWHELCHVVAAIMTGGTITRITIDPNLGGCSLVEGGNAPTILSAGYIGSTLFGGVFILAGWDTLVAKIMSFVLGIGLICPLVLVRDKLTIILTFCFEALVIGFWFADHGSALRWYCLFIGVMNIYYVIWDVVDDRFFRKANDSDATQFSLMFPRIPAHVWALFWILFQTGALIGFILLGISQFKLSDTEMAYEASRFLPT